MIDWQLVFYAVVSLSFTVGGWLYRELKAKADRTHEDLLIYKTHVAVTYVSNDKLTDAVSSLNQSVKSVADGVIRIENRLNNQIDNRQNHNGNHTN